MDGGTCVSNQRVKCKDDRGGTSGALWMLGGLNGSGEEERRSAGCRARYRQMRGAWGSGDGSCQRRTEHGMMGLGVSSLLGHLQGSNSEHPGGGQGVG